MLRSCLFFFFPLFQLGRANDQENREEGTRLNSLRKKNLTPGNAKRPGFFPEDEYDRRRLAGDFLEAFSIPFLTTTIGRGKGLPRKVSPPCRVKVTKRKKRGTHARACKRPPPPGRWTVTFTRRRLESSLMRDLWICTGAARNNRRSFNASDD